MVHFLWSPVRFSAYNVAKSQPTTNYWTGTRAWNYVINDMLWVPYTSFHWSPHLRHDILWSVTIRRLLRISIKDVRVDASFCYHCRRRKLRLTCIFMDMSLLVHLHSNLHYSTANYNQFRKPQLLPKNTSDCFKLSSYLGGFLCWSYHMLSFLYSRKYKFFPSHPL